MAKVQVGLRMEENVVQSLDSILLIYNDIMTEFSVKKASRADIVALLIEKEVEQLRSRGYKTGGKLK